LLNGAVILVNGNGIKGNFGLLTDGFRVNNLRLGHDKLLTAVSGRENPASDCGKRADNGFSNGSLPPQLGILGEKLTIRNNNMKNFCSKFAKTCQKDEPQIRTDIPTFILSQRCRARRELQKNK
jgi:hypothetical protein